MPRLTRLRAWLRRDRRDRWMLCEAAMLLGAARLAVALVPFRVLVRRLSAMPDGDRHDPELLHRVGAAVTSAAAHVPWKAVCLPQAIAAKAMLARRGHGSAIHFGVGNDGAGLSAHAWLRAGDTIVVGAAGIATVTPVTRFG